jgi:acetyl-CoA C-acetyltransferase
LACKDFETRLARNYASYYAPMARRFQDMYGVDERVRAEIAVKNRGYACSSPFAQQPGRHTIEEVLGGEIVSDPLRFLDRCAMSVGSAARPWNKMPIGRITRGRARPWSR